MNLMPQSAPMVVMRKITCLLQNSLYLHVLLRICYMDLVKKIHCFLKPSFTVLSLGKTVDTIHLLIQISEHGTYMLILLSHSRVKVS